MVLDKELLAILACPQCLQPVEADADEAWLVCRVCRVRYPVREGIPVMLAEEASPLQE